MRFAIEAKLGVEMVQPKDQETEGLGVGRTSTLEDFLGRTRDPFSLDAFTTPEVVALGGSTDAIGARVVGASTVGCALSGDQRDRLFSVPAGPERDAIDAVLRAGRLSLDVLTGDDLSTMWRVARVEGSEDAGRVWLLSCRGAVLRGQRLWDEANGGCERFEQMELLEGDAARRCTREEVFAATDLDPQVQARRAWAVGLGVSGADCVDVESALRMPDDAFDVARWHDCAGLTLHEDEPEEPGAEWDSDFLIAAGAIVRMRCENDRVGDARLRSLEVLTGERAWTVWQKALERSWSGVLRPSDRIGECDSVVSEDEAALWALAGDQYWYAIETRDGNLDVICRDFLDGEAASFRRVPEDGCVVRRGGVVADGLLDAWELSTLVARISWETDDDLELDVLQAARAERVRLAWVAAAALDGAYRPETGKLSLEYVRSSWARQRIESDPDAGSLAQFEAARARLGGGAIGPRSTVPAERPRRFVGSASPSSYPVMAFSKDRAPASLVGAFLLGGFGGGCLWWAFPAMPWLAALAVGAALVRYWVRTDRWRAGAKDRELRLVVDRDGIRAERGDGRVAHAWHFPDGATLTLMEASAMMPARMGVPGGIVSLLVAPASHAEASKETLLMMVHGALDPELQGRLALPTQAAPTGDRAAVQRVAYQLMLHGAWTVPPETAHAVVEAFALESAGDGA